jgi:CelD/BcsL family acetyltransferase involved in cellulose biosynthesis
VATIERIDDASRFAALRAEWDALLADSAADCVFLTWDWLQAWWTHLGGGQRLFLLAVREGGRLVGLAPLAVAPPALQRVVPFRALAFLGAGTAGSDYLDVIARRGCEEAVLHALAGALGGQRFLLHLARTRNEGSLAAALAQRLAAQRWTLRRSQPEVCPFIPLAGHDWRSYLATLGSAHRYNLQRRLRNLEKRYTVELARVMREEERRPALDRLIALHEDRWSTRGTSEAFRSPALVAFHDAFTRRALERGWLRLLELRLDGRPAAALYGLMYGGVFSFYQSGFDPAHARESVGLVAMGLAIRAAIEEGAREYDLLHGDEGYKASWARDARALTALELYPPSLRGRACRHAVGLGRAARQAARRWLPGELAQRLAAGLRAGARA